jgi:hypothetical protein
MPPLSDRYRSLPIVPNHRKLVGPLTIELMRETAIFYRANANSRIAVTPKVTPALAAGERASRGV